MSKAGAIFFVLAVTAAWVLWPYNAGPGEPLARPLHVAQQASR